MGEGAAGGATCRPHRLTICDNVHCVMNGADELIEHLVLNYGVAPGTESEDGIRLETTCCFASCDLGPNVEIDGDFFEGVTPERLDALLGRGDGAGRDREMREEREDR